MKSIQLIFASSRSDQDLLGILALQQKNLPVNLTPEEIAEQGFVTVTHNLEDLKKMNAIEQHIICKDNEKVIAYLLAMTIHSKNDLPILYPMFEEFDKIVYKDKPLSRYNYIIVGQVCVDKNYRGQGILDKCYEEYKHSFNDKYDFAITEISTRNLRSIKAHLRIGFKEIHRYTSPDNEEWSIVIWEW